MTLSGPATRLSIFLGEDDTWHHKPVYREILLRARAARLAGGTVLRGCEGYGHSTLIHTTRLLDLAENLPILVIIVDIPDRIRAFLPELDEIIGNGTIVLDDVDVLRYGATTRQ